MKVLVLGAGVAGMTTAYQLNRDGHEVTVIEREAEPANFTSYANAGLFAPGHSYAWSSPAAPGILLRSLWRNDQALRFRPSLDPDFWRWMWAFWKECNAERAAANTTVKANLCNYSLDVFHDTVAETGIEYDGNSGGLLYLYRSPDAFKAAATKANILIRNNVEILALDRAQTVQLDPSLTPVAGELSGALFAPNDESGDCRIFCQGLHRLLKDRGVRFKFGTTVKKIEANKDRISGIVTNQGYEKAEAYVLCLGVYSPHLVKPLGVNLKIYPVKGYSVTLPTDGRNGVPAIGGVDEENLVAYCPMGDRLRVTATAEFSGYGRDHSPADFSHMLKMMRNLFPDAADYSKPDYWAGLRPMTPQGTPILGRGRHRNLWFNTGLGHMGWTMSHATARITADIISGQQPAIALDGMTV